MNDINKNPKVSFLIHTASTDNFLSSQNIDSYFESLLINLQNQTFKNFELIYIDRFYENNKDKFKSLYQNLNFTVKHVPIHKEHRYWFDLGYTFISAAKNTGILYADGELLITCDDAEFFPPNLIAKYWKYYQNKCYMIGLHKRMKSISTKEGKISFPISGEIYINDFRLKDLSKVKYHKDGSQCCAGTSFSLQDGLRINGFNERMDGCKSLEDCDFGRRLSLLGNKFVNDPSGFLYILDHPSYIDVKINPIDYFIAIENYAVLLFSTELNEIRANTNPITEQHINILQRETKKYRGFDPLENKNNFNVWLNTPTFDLSIQRQQLRESEDWIWK